MSRQSQFPSPDALFRKRLLAVEIRGPVRMSRFRDRGLSRKSISGIRDARSENRGLPPHAPRGALRGRKWRSNDWNPEFYRFLRLPSFHLAESPVRGGFAYFHCRVECWSLMGAPVGRPLEPLGPAVGRFGAVNRGGGVVGGGGVLTNRVRNFSDPCVAPMHPLFAARPRRSRLFFASASDVGR